MSLRNVSDYSPRSAVPSRWFDAKPYRIFMIAGAAFIAAYAIQQAFSLALLSVTIFDGNLPRLVSFECQDSRNPGA